MRGRCGQGLQAVRGTNRGRLSVSSSQSGPRARHLSEIGAGDRGRMDRDYMQGGVPCVAISYLDVSEGVVYRYAPKIVNIKMTDF